MKALKGQGVYGGITKPTSIVSGYSKLAQKEAGRISGVREV
jgi:hypothetical protein